MNPYMDLTQHRGTSAFDLFNITPSADIEFLPLSGGNGNGKAIAWYSGSGAISLTDYKNLPKGSIIHDLQAHKDHEKVGEAGTDTWVSSAARS